MADERRMTTDRFFGGVDGRLENLQLMLTYVRDAEPTQDELWSWLKTNTEAGSDSTIEKYVQFVRALFLLKRQDNQYRTTDIGTQYAETGDSGLIFDALTEYVKGFETILQAIDNGDRTKANIQRQLREQYPDYSLPMSIVGRHLEWLEAVGAVATHDEQYILTTFGQRKANELDAGAWITPVYEGTDDEPWSGAGLQDNSEDLENLRKQAEREATDSVSSTTTEREITEYDRSEAVRRYVKQRADGRCEGCSEPAPFQSQAGDPYLHAHHIHELADGGPDTPDTVIALCPNCHYRVHHGHDGPAYNRELAHQLATIEDTAVDEILRYE